MGRYIIKRILMTLLTMWLLFTITFFLMHAVPGSPFIGEKRPPQKVIDLMNAKFGLDKNIFVQYTTYLGNALQLDFGPSIQQRGQTVIEIIGRTFPYSLRLGLVTVCISVIVGTLFGIVTALKRNSWVDRTVMFISTIGIAVPGFVVATLSIILFGVTLKWLPIRGLDTPIKFIMPSFALSFFSLSFISRLMRSSMLDVVNQDYIRTARAKGLSEGLVVFKHAVRNAILPVVSYVGPLLAMVVTGAFVVERIFSIPGMGKYFVEAIQTRDYPMIMGMTLMYGFVIIIMTAVVDIVYGLVDPRIKVEE